MKESERFRLNMEKLAKQRQETEKLILESYPFAHPKLSGWAIAAVTFGWLCVAVTIGILIGMFF